MTKLFQVFIALFMITSANLSFAQQSDWTSYNEVDGVKIQYKVVECHDEVNGLHQEIILFKFANTNSKDVEISWHLNTWLDGKCSNCETNDPEHDHKIKLTAGQTLTGECGINTNRHLRLFKKFLNHDTKELTKFELTNLKVRILE